MWASSMALNGLIGCGKGSQSWSCHPIEHELSAFYDITHGAGLAIVTPKWMRHILNEKTARRFKKYTRNVFHVQDTGDEFFKDIGLPSTLSELGIDDSKIQVMAHNAVIHGRLDNAYVPLDDMDVEKILRACL